MKKVDREMVRNLRGWINAAYEDGDSAARDIVALCDLAEVCLDAEATGVLASTIDEQKEPGSVYWTAGPRSLALHKIRALLATDADTDEYHDHLGLSDA